MTSTIRSSLVLCLLLTGCANDGSYQRKRDEIIFDALTRQGLVRLESVRSISRLRVDGWRAIDDYSLILTSRRQQHYLVTLMAQCRNLDFALGIAFDGMGGTVTRNDNLIVQDMSGAQQRCRIADIVALEEIPGYVEE